MSALRRVWTGLSGWVKFRLRGSHYPYLPLCVHAYFAHTRVGSPVPAFKSTITALEADKSLSPRIRSSFLSHRIISKEKVLSSCFPKRLSCQSCHLLRHRSSLLCVSGQGSVGYSLRSAPTPASVLRDWEVCVEFVCEWSSFWAEQLSRYSHGASAPPPPVGRWL